MGCMVVIWLNVLVAVCFDCGCFVYVCCLLLLWVGFAVSDLLMVVGGDSYFLLMFCGYTD